MTSIKPDVLSYTITCEHSKTQFGTILENIILIIITMVMNFE